MNTKEEVLRLAEAAGFKRNPFYPQLLTARDMDPIQLMGACEKLIELAKAQGAAEERESCALWYEDLGYLLDEQDISDAIRNRERKE